MSEPYMPTTEEVREAISEWAWSRRMFRPELAQNDGREADRWLNRVRAEALREAAKNLDEHFQDIPAWMEAYREGVRTDEWMQGGVRMVMSAVDVLNARADVIEQNSEGSGT